jgi:hypothetical protein
MRYKSINAYNFRQNPVLRQNKVDLKFTSERILTSVYLDNSTKNERKKE